MSSSDAASGERGAFDREAWIARERVRSPRARSSVLRETRRGAEVALGADGRRLSPAEALAGGHMLTPEELSEAAGLVDQAREHADELVRGAMAEAISIEERARRRGYETGYREGTAAARAELAEALAVVQQAAGAAKEMRDQLYAAAEADLVELVITASEAVIGESIASDPHLVVETVRRALERAGAQNVMRVRVHPEEIERVQVWLHERRGDIVPYEVVGDETIAVGGCVIDTAAGIVDARLDVELVEVARLLRDAIPPESSAMRERPLPRLPAEALDA